MMQKYVLWVSGFVLWAMGAVYIMSRTFGHPIGEWVAFVPMIALVVGYLVMYVAIRDEDYKE